MKVVVLVWRGAPASRPELDKVKEAGKEPETTL
jgi:hypothetical protein